MKLANTTPQRNQAANAMAVSYAFESKAADAIKFLTPVRQQQRADKDAAAPRARPTPSAASTWRPATRRTAGSGTTSAARTRSRSPGCRSRSRISGTLRWIHAQARIAAREGKADEARKHVTAFEQVMQKRGKLAEDNEIYRYLVGYVAYYTKDYDKAIAELAKGNLTDPFIANLLAMAYEAKGDVANAQQYYRRALESNVHILNAAFAHPVARKLARPASDGCIVAARARCSRGSHRHHDRTQREPA